MLQPWFKNAKFGIFIHWGIYSVEGIDESWAMGRGKMSYNEYMKALDGFSASDYDAEEWASLFKKSGAKYAVLTTKHHEGVALFDTKYSDMSVVNKCPAKRDLVKPYCDALRKEGLKVGLYFSNTDWSCKEHMEVILDKTADEIDQIRKESVHYDNIWNELLDREEKENITSFQKQKQWEKFMNLYEGQINELTTNYGPIDLLWFDVMIERKGYSWKSKEIKDLILKNNPKTIINSRLGDYGDYETPELYIPLRQRKNPWELCGTVSEYWGYRKNDDTYKSVDQIIRILTECIWKGGNFLLSIGPDGKGTIPEKTKNTLLEIGKWINKYEEAVFPTEEGIAPEYFAGPSTLSKDKKTLYLFVFDCSHEKIMLNGIRDNFTNIINLKTNKKLNYNINGGAWWIDVPGQTWIELPKEEQDEICTVIKIEMKNQINLLDINYQGQSKGEQ